MKFSMSVIPLFETSNDPRSWNNIVYNTQGYQMGICNKNASIGKFSKFELIDLFLIFLDPQVWPPIDSLKIDRGRQTKK